MLKCVVILGDHESANISVQKTLTDLLMEHPKFTYYCYDALRLIIVRKGRHDAKRLRQPVEGVSAVKKHLIADLSASIKEKNSYEFSNYEISLVRLFSKGMMQMDIPVNLKQNSIKPAVLRSATEGSFLLEKLLNSITMSRWSLIAKTCALTMPQLNF